MLPSASERALYRARAYYFFYFAAIGCYNLYITLYYQQRGLAGGAIGLLAALPAVISVAAGPLWNSLADRFQLHRRLLPLLTVAPILPIWLQSRTGDLVWLAALVALAAVFNTALAPLIDSAVLELTAGTRHSYGRTRVWGSFGFISAAALTGAVFRPEQPAALFLGYGLCMLTAAAAAWGLPARQRRLPASFGAGLRRLLRQRVFALFLISAGLIGAATQAAFTFYPLYLRHLGVAPAFIGLAASLATLSEIPGLYLASSLLRRLGAWGCTALGTLTYTLRWLLVAASGVPGLAIAVQTAHSLSFAPYLVGSVAFVDEHAPAGVNATAQAVFTATQWGLGAALGAMLGGWAFEYLGPAGLFYAAAAGTALGLGGLGLVRAADPGRG